MLCVCLYIIFLISLCYMIVVNKVLFLTRSIMFSSFVIKLNLYELLLYDFDHYLVLKTLSYSSFHDRVSTCFPSVPPAGLIQPALEDFPLFG